MKITKERLKNLIREQMNSMAEASDDEHGMGGEDPPTLGDVKFSGRYDQSFDDDAPMMPPKPSEDIPLKGLTQGVESLENQVKEKFGVGTPEYSVAMQVLNMINKQNSKPDSSTPPGDLEHMWKFMDRSSKLAGEPQPKNPLQNPFSGSERKITKEQLKRIVKEELKKTLEETGPTVQGQDEPNSSKYTELLEAFKEAMDVAFGENNYNLYKELKAIAEHSARGGETRDPENRNADAWDFFKRSDEKSGVISPKVSAKMKNPFKSR